MSEQIRRNFKEVFNLSRRWLARTKEVLARERNKLGVDDTLELKQSVKTRQENNFPMIKLLLLMKLRGRFVDMGAGRNYRKIQSMENNRSRIRRRPKKWYSRPFYGRLNDLQGAIGYKMMEQALESTTRNLRKE